MATPAMTGDPRLQQFLANRQRQLNEQNLFIPENPYTRQHAASIAFQEMLELKNARSQEEYNMILARQAARRGRY